MTKTDPKAVIQPAQPPNYVEKAAAFASAANAAASLVHEVADVVRICADCAKNIEEQRTEQTRIHERARVQIELIQSRRDLMVGFLSEAFRERRQNFDELFQRLDTAMERDNVAGARDVLGAIVTLAKSSPFDALRDAALAHEALLDKSITWEF